MDLLNDKAKEFMAALKASIEARRLAVSQTETMLNDASNYAATVSDILASEMGQLEVDEALLKKTMDQFQDPYAIAKNLVQD